MEIKHEFYPMISRTARTILSLASKQEEKEIFFILKYYPLHGKIPEKEIDSFSGAPKELLKEFDRQYARWNKGGLNEI